MIENEKKDYEKGNILEGLLHDGEVWHYSVDLLNSVEKKKGICIACHISIKSKCQRALEGLVEHSIMPKGEIKDKE